MKSNCLYILKFLPTIRVNEKLSEIIEKLWNLDEHKLTRNKDYIIDLQGLPSFLVSNAFVYTL